MSNINSTILAAIEWDESLSMPIANEENKELEKLIQNKHSSLAIIESELAETEDRVVALHEHLKNMRQELEHTQSLANAREKELETEIHMLKLTQREKGHLKQQITNFMKLMDDLKISINALENNSSWQSQKMVQLKSQLNWDEQALEAWLEESAKKDDDVMTIQKYTRQDETKIKELSLLVEKLITDALQKKHQLNVEVTNTMSIQLELEKAAEQFVPAHREREQLLLQYEITIQLMYKRDRDFDLFALKIEETKKGMRRRNRIMHNKAQELERERHANSDKEIQISRSERTSIQTKAQLSQIEMETDQFQNETEMLKRNLERMALDMDLTYAERTQVTKEIIDKKNKLHQAMELRKELEQRLHLAVQFTLSIGEQATTMDDLLMAEERKQEKLLVEVKILEVLLCKTQKDLYAAMGEERAMDANINCSHNAMKNIISKAHRLDSDALKQQEILYTQNLVLQQLEKRHFRMQGEQSAEDKTALEDKINELHRIIEQKHHSHATLVAQLRKLQDNWRHVFRDVSMFQAEKSNLLIKIDDCNLQNASSELKLKNIIKQKQDLMVNHSILKLEIKKIQSLLNCQTDDILSKEMRKVQLDTALTERHQEIKTHQEMLLATIKVTEEKRQHANTELYDRMSKIDKLKMRYQFMIVSMVAPSASAETSQVYFVIKAAQEKEALQREGDDLDKNIRKAEKEVQALENTLNLLNRRNGQYQQNFNKVAETNDEIERKHNLDEQMKAGIDKYKYKKRQINELLDELQKKNTRLDSLIEQEHALTESLRDKKDKIAQFNKETLEQREKLKRAAKLNASYLRAVRSCSKVFGELPQENDIKIRELREFNRNLMTIISDAAKMYPEMITSVQEYFTKENLPLPFGRLVLSSQASQRNSTVASSIVSKIGTTSTYLADPSSDFNFMGQTTSQQDLPPE